MKLVDGTGDDWVVTSQTITVPAEPGTEVLLVAAAPKPVLTLAQENAVEQGLSYLDYSGFSRTSLIGQVEYEGYHVENATFAVDFIAPDWGVESAEKPKSYLEYSSFSRDGSLDNWRMRASLLRRLNTVSLRSTTDGLDKFDVAMQPVCPVDGVGCVKLVDGGAYVRTK